MPLLSAVCKRLHRPPAWLEAWLGLAVGKEPSPGVMVMVLPVVLRALNHLPPDCSWDSAPLLGDLPCQPAGARRRDGRGEVC